MINLYRQNKKLLTVKENLEETLVFYKKKCLKKAKKKTYKHIHLYNNNNKELY